MTSQALIPANIHATILRNSGTLWQEGYRVELIAGDGLFKVFNILRPESSYTVETRGEKTCECICFQRYNRCKHCDGIVLLIQCQMSSYYLRMETLRQELKKHRGTMDYLAYKQAYAEKLDNAAFELECALSDLTGTGEFYMPRKLTGYVAEIGETEIRRAA